MEELLKNFSEHLKQTISPVLGETVQAFVSEAFEGPYQEENDIIEHEVKTILKNYFRQCNDEEFTKISERLYNGFIDSDDTNIVSSVKIFVRFYSKFEDLKLKRLFYKWRINSLFKQSLSRNKVQPVTIVKSQEEVNHIEKTRTKSKKILTDMREGKSTKNNLSNSLSNLNSIKNTNNFNVQKYVDSNTYTNDNGDIFNRLYKDSFKKQDDKLLRDEIKRISELDECTFKPNAKKIIKK
jgi:hypothetical protein